MTSFTYDKNGNLTSDGRGMYTYDDFDQMTSAKMENGDLFTCRYDAEGLRHETEENGHLIKYIYKNRDVAVEESEEEGTTRYIRGNGRLIASDSEKARTYYHYVSDNIGSITYILNNTFKI